MDAMQFGRYEVIEEIGRGGMATVYKALDPRFDREVAVKVLPPAFLHDPNFRARFEREARVVAALEHPAIVPVYDYGEENGQPYLVMQYMEGGSLAQRVKDLGALTIPEATRILKRIGAALDAAHRKGIIHRDLKPANILFDKAGDPFLTDFGIAKLAEGTVSLTGSGIIGTPAYMSPEQVQGDKAIDGRSDIYSLGIILFQVLTGVLPYQGDTPMRQLYKHVSDPIPSIQASRKDLPGGADTLIQRALAKAPHDRYQTASDLVRDLEGIDNIPAPTQQPQTKDTPTWADTTPLDSPVSPDERATIPDAHAPLPKPLPRPQARHQERPGEKIEPRLPSQPKPQTDQPSRPVWLVGCVIAAVGLGAIALLVGGWWVGGDWLMGRANPTASRTPRGNHVEDSPTVTYTLKPGEPTYTLGPTSKNPTFTLLPTLARTATRVSSPTPTGYRTPTPSLYYPLSGCAASHLHRGDSAYVSYGGGSNGIRSSPNVGNDNNIIGQAAEGEVMVIIDGPSCSYGWVMWKVVTANDVEGWTPEGDDNNFWLQPITSQRVCSNSMPTRLYVGARAFVGLYPPLSNNVRSSPGLSATLLGQIDPGGRMDIQEGPRCANNIVWWKVRASTGLTGWTGEGEDYYWLIPIP